MAQKVWDRFLTEQDKAHLASGRARRQGGFGEKPALLLVDLYRCVFGDKPEPLLESIKNWRSSCGLTGWNALPKIQQLLGTARELGIPIIHSTGVTDSVIKPWVAHPMEDQSSDMTPEAQDRFRRRFDIVDEVKPLPGEMVIEKSSPSVFWGSPLIGHLNGLGVDTVLTCGESTSGCVRATVVDGCTYRFRMIVVEEGVFDRHEACHAINLFDMNQKYASVLPLAEALDYLHTFKKPSTARRWEGVAEGAAVGAARK